MFVSLKNEKLIEGKEKEHKKLLEEIAEIALVSKTRDEQVKKTGI